MDKHDLTMLSLAEAIAEGRAWSPSFHRHFLESVAAGTDDHRVARSSWAAHDAGQIVATAAKALATTGSTQGGGKQEIFAGCLREVLMCCEEDEFRHNCKDDKTGCDPAGKAPGCRSRVINGAIVARFGVKIEKAVIEGFLDLAGIKFERPLVFSDCRFTHSIDISRSRLGAVAFRDGCRFDKAPLDGDEAIARYSRCTAERISADSSGSSSTDHESHNECSHDPGLTPGNLPDAMKLAQGIYARGATLASLDIFECVEPGSDAGSGEQRTPGAESQAARANDGDGGFFRRLWGRQSSAGGSQSPQAPKPRPFFAQRLDFRGATIAGTVDFRGVWVSHPKFKKGTLRGHPPQEDRHPFAVDFRTARIGNLWMNDCAIGGGLRVRDGAFGGLRLTDNHIAAATYKDSRIKKEGGESSGLALDGRNISVESDILLRRTPDRRNNSDCGLGDACVKGRIDFESARIEDSVRIAGVKIEHGLADGHPEVLKYSESADRQAVRALILRNSVIGGVLRFSGYEPEPEDYEKLRLKKESPCFSCNAEVDLRNIKVANEVRFENCLVKNTLWTKSTNSGARGGGTVIDLRGASIGNTLLFRRFDSKCDGNIDLRDARAGVYRDDFGWACGGAREAISYVLGIIPWGLIFAIAFALLLHIYLTYLWAFVILISTLLISNYLLLLRWPRHPKAAVAEWWSGLQLPWPKNLRLALAGFDFGSFAIRDSADTRDNADSSRMPISNGARLRWLRHQPKFWLDRKFQPQPWIHTARVLARQGYFQQAQRILLERERGELRAGDFSYVERMLRWFLVVICGHGRNLTRAVVLTVFVFVIALAVNTVAIDSNLIRPTDAILLVDGAYKQGDVPPEYTAPRVLPYTIGRILPFWPQGGREWSPCSSRQIRLAITEGHRGACRPLTCNMIDEPLKGEPSSERDTYGAIRKSCTPLEFDSIEPLRINLSHAAPALPRGNWLPDPVRSSDDWRRKIDAWLADFVSNSPWIARWVARVDLLAVAWGWFISLILGIYAVGLLRRREE